MISFFSFIIDHPNNPTVHIKTDIILAEVLKDLGYKLKDRIVLRQRRSRNGELLSQVLLVMKYNSKNGTI